MEGELRRAQVGRQRRNSALQSGTLIESRAFDSLQDEQGEHDGREPKERFGMEHPGSPVASGRKGA
jgi:hypothetical protein